MAGKIVADTLEHSTAGSLDTSYVVNGSAKHCGHFNGSNMAIGESLNQSSITDNGVGDYSPQLASNMNTSGYCFYCEGRPVPLVTYQRSLGGIAAQTTSSFRFGSTYATNLGGLGASYDDEKQNTATFGGLA